MSRVDPRRSDTVPLINILGDLPCMDIDRRMHCENCGKPDYLRLRTERLTDEQMAGARFRRLLRIKALRRQFGASNRRPEHYGSF